MHVRACVCVCVCVRACVYVCACMRVCIMIMVRSKYQSCLCVLDHLVLWHCSSVDFVVCSTESKERREEKKNPLE